MDEQESFGSYFNSALRIHAVCADLEYSDEEARVYTYIHTKAVESGRGVEYFYNPAPEDSEALEIMLGMKRTLELPPAITLDEQESEALDLILSIADHIEHLDGILVSECGMENRFSGELRARLRLYKDVKFRDAMISNYVNIVEPKINQYDEEAITEAFRKHQEHDEMFEKELRELLGLNGLNLN
ncbi:MAG: hypothetical protein LBI42_13195 [Chitinispirillales bacterium]|jgi:hypothetical protein|nr:hypothetical protein [Chitinispirillales bacterium]